MQEWAEVHRLFYRENRSKAEIAERLGMSRTTVYRLLALKEPPRYEPPAPSLLDPHKPKIIDHLRREGNCGGITILKDYLAKVRCEFLLAVGHQRTTYLPGEIGHTDWWEPPLQVPVGKGHFPQGLRLRHHPSALHRPCGRVQLPQGDTGLLEGLIGCLERLGGIPEKLAWITMPRSSSPAGLHAGKPARLGEGVVRASSLAPGGA